MEITITIPEVLASKARTSGLPPDVYIERLLDRIAAASIGREGNRELLRDELLADWEHYRATGLHLDKAEVDGWLAQLADGQMVDPPALHS